MLNINMKYDNLLNLFFVIYLIIFNNSKLTSFQLIRNNGINVFICALKRKTIFILLKPQIINHLIMKKISAFLVCLFLIANLMAKAEAPATTLKKEAYEDASKRITLVVIMADDPKKGAKPKKNVADDEMHKKDMEAFNSQLQTAVKKWWKFTERYEFKSLAEVQKLAKGKTNKGYLVLQYVMHSDVDAAPKPAAAAVSVIPFNKLSKPELCGYFEVRQAENMVPNKPALAETPITFQAPNLFEDVFAIHALQYHLYNHMEGLSPNEIKANIQANAKNLLSKTLLIDKNDIAESSFNESKMKNLYPYEYLYVESDSCGQKAMEGNADFAFVKIVPTDDGKLLHYVISCEDGTVCNYFESKYEAKRRDRIKAEALKAYAKYVK
ncbi:MAG: hypothetical protein RL708_1059 [Bacteroidota bacterium]